jgi:zinc protease
VGKITREKLHKYHQAWIKPERLVISLSGAVNRSALDQWLAGLEKTANAHARAAAAAQFPAQLPEEPMLKAPRWVEKSLKREQAHIMLGGLGSRIDAEDFFTIRVLQTLLGGQSGRLFIELREKKSLAYSTAPLSFEGIERGYIGTYIACAPQKRDEAIQGTRTVLETLAKKGPSPAEMKRAQEFFLGSRAMDMQSDSSLAADFGLKTLYGLPLLTDDEVMKRIKAVTGQQVRKACERYYVEPHLVTAIVG